MQVCVCVPVWSFLQILLSAKAKAYFGRDFEMCAGLFLAILVMLDKLSQVIIFAKQVSVF